MSKLRCRSIPLAASLSLWWLSLGELPAQAGPDFVKGETIPEKAEHDWNLGATGARGWMHTEKMVTTQGRQVLITAVAPGSPADGVLEVGDVLLGVDGKSFGYDPRTEIGKALTVAESRAGGGRLSLRRWRAGQLGDVTVELPVLGSYSATAPYGCDKSERILERGLEVLAARMNAKGYEPNPIPRCLNALALLASGDERYLPLVEREAQWAANYSVDSFATWYYGYVSMLLAEYVMATGDDSVLPGLRRSPWRPPRARVRSAPGAQVRRARRTPAGLRHDERAGRAADHRRW
jgi:hypothetical protein